ncbi:MAG: nucleotidyltransferase domain-containing protein [Oscillospiraceae bacterium]|nr:nucleotidyltransferase domain-containing protein [Oscillospiraceae bacterium]
MQNPSGCIPDIVIHDIENIVNCFIHTQFANNIVKIILFGSFANNKYQPDSDIDIAVVVKKKPDNENIADYCLITDNIKRSVDMLFCTEKQLYSGQYVFSEIIREGVVIYENI